MKWDLFICHASEDKDDFVRPLAHALQGLGLRVWYDEFALRLGHSIRDSVERGLAESRYGVVVLSPSFLTKDWARRELDALVAKEVNGNRVILPVWHKVGVEEVRQVSLLLADRLAISSTVGVEEVAKAVGIVMGNHQENAPTRPGLTPSSEARGHVLANFKEEHKVFEEFLGASCPDRILIFHGISGSGKTSLLDDCLSQLDGKIRPVRIDLRNGAVGVVEIFWRAGAQLGWNRLPKFTRAVAKLQPDRVQVSQKWLIGIKSHIRKALNAMDIDERDGRRELLTDAIFEDIRGLGQQLVLIAFDTYEQAITEATSWIEGTFLARVANVPHVRVLIAGQSVPAPLLGWTHRVRAIPLTGILAATEWLPVMEAMGRNLPEGETVDYLRRVCLALEGNPSQIMKILETWPRREGML